MEYFEAYEKYINGQTIQCEVSYWMGELPNYVYGYGFKYTNGYQYISYGAGACGRDAQYKYILDCENNLVASEKWKD